MDTYRMGFLAWKSVFVGQNDHLNGSFSLDARPEQGAISKSVLIPIFPISFVVPPPVKK